MDIEHYKTNRAWTADRKCECGGFRFVVGCPITLLSGQKARVDRCEREGQHYHIRCGDCRKEEIREDT